MKQGQIIFRLLFPANQNPAKSIHPAMRSFHHPPPGLESSFMLDSLSFLAASPDMSRVTELDCQVSDLVVVISFIQTKILFGFRTFHSNACQSCPDHLHVVAIGALDSQSNRDS